MNEVMQRRYVLFVLFLVSVFSYVDRTILSILQVPIKAELGLSDGQLGALTGLSFALFYTTLSLPIARWADRGVRKNIIAGALAVWSGMTALTGLAGNYLSLLFFRIGVAAGEAGSIPASHSIIADIYPPRVRATALAIWGLSLPVGTMVGYLAAGALAEALGWRAAFAVIGIAGVLLAPLVVLTIREPQRGRFDPAPVSGASVPNWSQALRKLWELRTYRFVIAGAALHAFVYYSLISWSAPFYTRVHGMSIGQVSFYLAFLTGIGGAIGMYLGGHLSDRCGRRNPAWRSRVVAIALLAIVPAAIAQHQVGDTSMSLVLGAITCTLLPFYYGPVVGIPQLLVPASMRAFTSAVTLLITNLIGLGLGPLFTGLVSDFLIRNYDLASDSLRYAISLSALSSLAAAWMFWRAGKHLPHEMLVAVDADETRDSAGPAQAVPASR